MSFRFRIRCSSTDEPPQPVITNHIFYDGPTPPADLFKGFLDLPVLVPFPVGTYSMSTFLTATQGPRVGDTPRYVITVFELLWRL